MRGILVPSLAAALALSGTARAADDLRIGLFAPSVAAERSAGGEVRRGSEIAIASANRGGGVAGRSLALVSADSDLPWGKAAPALVRLIYDEHAVAVIGALDARTAHLAEQIVTRSRGESLFVTTWASETALTRLRIPWFFSVVPDDRRQAAALAREIFTNRRIPRAAAWVEDSPDARSALSAFLGAAPPAAVAVFGPSRPAPFEEMRSSLLRGDPGALVLFASPREAARVAAALRASGIAAPVFGTLALATPEFLASPDGSAEGIVLVAPRASDPSIDAAFRAAYRARHGAEPTPLAAYGHDAVLAIVAALRRGAPGSAASLASALAAVRLEGATGFIQFDPRRGRDLEPALAIVRSGALVPLAAEGASR
ncbi:MAG: ABC transporter substrate-binding protein [Acidobacteria bacterium]|nr:ABC transporter substrate-binding protein [Acidobacteriota bacterium]